MRGLALVIAALPAGCGDKVAEAPEASVQRGIDRSVADVRAAQAAAAKPIAPSLSAAELAARLPATALPAKEG